MRLKEALCGRLDEKELKLVPNSFDLVGDILVFADFPTELKKKERIIAQRILGLYPHIKVVCKKTGKYSGEYRLPKLKIIGGEMRKETTHKENGIRIRLNIEKVYFSARLGHERERIRELTKKGESVLVMFSGCGIYCINLAKKAKEVYGIEINPTAHKYGLENIKLNKTENIKLFLGDVRRLMPKIRKKFDRIIMPLPRNAENFLYLALPKLRKTGIIHLYQFLEEKEVNKGRITSYLLKYIPKFQILKIVRCGQYAPGKHRVCLDLRIL